MARTRSRIVVLDSAYYVWRWDHRHEVVRRGRAKEDSAVVLPFTFADAPHDLVRGDGDIVLRPTGGVKS